MMKKGLLVMMSLITLSCQQVWAKVPPSGESVIEAVEKAKVEKLESLFDGVSPSDTVRALNYKEPIRGNTALHIAAMLGDTEKVNFILWSGAPAGLRNKKGETALAVARAFNKTKVIPLLEKPTQDFLGKNLVLAAWSGELEKAKELINAGAEVNFQFPVDIAHAFRRTPLLDAAARGHYPMVEFLVKQGAQVNLTDLRGLSPLHDAATAKAPDIVKFLLAEGADVNHASNTGETPLMSAAIQGHPEIVKLLLDAGAKLSAKNKEGMTATDIAREKGKIEVIPLLEKPLPALPKKRS